MAAIMLQPACAVKFTYEDFLHLPDDGKRYEIIDGELYMSPAPNLDHQRIVLKLSRKLSEFVDSNNLGEVFIAPCDVVFSEINVVEPDILFISTERLHILTEANVQGAPDLVIEVLSSGTEKRDRGIKLKTYAKFGVREYWLADPENKTVEIYRLDKRGLKIAARLAVDDGLTSPLLRGLEISLQEIF
jgi:Uma2 family endonuclease